MRKSVYQRPKIQMLSEKKLQQLVPTSLIGQYEFEIVIRFEGINTTGIDVFEFEFPTIGQDFAQNGETGVSGTLVWSPLSINSGTVENTFTFNGVPVEPSQNEDFANAQAQAQFRHLLALPYNDFSSAILGTNSQPVGELESYEFTLFGSEVTDFCLDGNPDEVRVISQLQPASQICVGF